MGLASATTLTAPYNLNFGTADPGEVSPGPGTGASSCNSLDGWCSFETTVAHSLWGLERLQRCHRRTGRSGGRESPLTRLGDTPFSAGCASLRPSVMPAGRPGCAHRAAL